MARVSLSTAERSMFLPVRTVSDASGLCKCSINVPFVVWELTVNNNNGILIHFLQRKIFNLQMYRLLVHLVHAYQSFACETAINTDFSELFSLKRIYVKYKNAILLLIDCFFRI